MSNNWRDKEPTQAQLSFLVGLGYTYKVPSTRGEASDILDRLNKPKHRSRIHKQPQNHPITTSQDRFGEIDSA